MLLEKKPTMLLLKWLQNMYNFNSALAKNWCVKKKSMLTR